ncbi:hypothetical protein [Shimia sp. R9_3]|uniref:hypothetical protein n=1 Tax=Shimia sp. R9_3 TaxID=2821113 RepID=UPI001ADAA1AA|nr:hypothetical protein [Shimia sp. R9_3]MBO9402531.1 hypothetical protein [Shimia sp. R9_3]
MHKLLDDQEEECSALRLLLEEALSDSNPIPSIQEMRSIADAGQECLRNLKALFGALNSQADPDDISREIYLPIDRVLDVLISPDKFGLKDKAFTTVLLTTIAMIVIYPAWR